MLGLGAIVSSLSFTLGHKIDFLGLIFLSTVYFHITEVGEEGGGRGEGFNLDLASSSELKSVVSSPNKRKKDLRSSGTTTRQKLGLIPGRILLLSYKILRKNFGYLSSGQALPPDVEGPAGFLSLFLSSSVILVFYFHEPTAFKLSEGMQDPLHMHPSFPSTTSRFLRRVISTILRLCSNVISSAWLDGTTLKCTTLSEEVAKMETQGFSIYRNVSISFKAGHS